MLNSRQIENPSVQRPDFYPGTVDDRRLSAEQRFGLDTISAPIEDSGIVLGRGSRPTSFAYTFQTFVPRAAFIQYERHEKRFDHSVSRSKRMEHVTRLREGLSMAGIGRDANRQKGIKHAQYSEINFNDAYLLHVGVVNPNLVHRPPPLEAKQGRDSRGRFRSRKTAGSPITMAELFVALKHYGYDPIKPIRDEAYVESIEKKISDGLATIWSRGVKSGSSPSTINANAKEFVAKIGKNLVEHVRQYIRGGYKPKLAQKTMRNRRWRSRRNPNLYQAGLSNPLWETGQICNAISFRIDSYKTEALEAFNEQVRRIVRKEEERNKQIAAEAKKRRSELDRRVRNERKIEREIGSSQIRKASKPQTMRDADAAMDVIRRNNALLIRQEFLAHKDEWVGLSIGKGITRSSSMDEILDSALKQFTKKGGRYYDALKSGRLPGLTRYSFLDLVGFMKKLGRVSANSEVDRIARGISDAMAREASESTYTGEGVAESILAQERADSTRRRVGR